MNHVRGQKFNNYLLIYIFIILLAVLDWVCLNLTKHMNLGLSWLFEEYSVNQGFIKLPTAFRNSLSAEENYNTVLCTLIRAALNGLDSKEKEE